MKQISSFLWTLVLVCTFTTLSAQADRNTITVYGAAEKAVEPDEFYLSITLSEYMNNGMKIPLSELERKLMDATKAIGITSLAVENISGYGSYGYEGEQGFLASKMYQIKTKDLNTVEQLMSKLETAGMSALSISYYANSKAKSHQRELKVQAIKNAQEEADALAKALGKKVGNVVSLQEVQDPSTYTVYPMDAYSNPPSGTNSSGLVARNITYKYSVMAVFELQ